MAAASRRAFKGSKTIINAEEPVTRLFLVTGGHIDYFVLTSNGKEILLKRMVSGDAFGVTSFISDQVSYLGTAVSARSSEFLEWPCRAVLELAKAHPRFGENSTRISLAYVFEFVQRHGRLASNSVSQRLGSVVAGLAHQAGHVLPSGVESELKNEDLASLADTTLFTASRILKMWEREGTLTKSRGKVLILRPKSCSHRFALVD